MQQLNPSEISEIIKQRIDQLDVSSEARNEGTVVSVTDGIIRIHGLAEVMYGEMIEFEGGVYGMALNLERDVRVSTSTDKDLLGGVLIRAGDLVIDGSVRGRLNKLAEAMNT